jgi:hypothetical protein
LVRGLRTVFSISAGARGTALVERERAFFISLTSGMMELGEESSTEAERAGTVRKSKSENDRLVGTGAGTGSGAAADFVEAEVL